MLRLSPLCQGVTYKTVAPAYFSCRCCVKVTAAHFGISTFDPLGLSEVSIREHHCGCGLSDVLCFGFYGHSSGVELSNANWRIGRFRFESLGTKRNNVMKLILVFKKK